MRTTVNISDALLEAAKARARERGTSLGAVVDVALRRELSAPTAATPPPEIPVFRGGNGLLPGVEVSSNRAIYELLDEEDGHAVFRE